MCPAGRARRAAPESRDRARERPSCQLGATAHPTDRAALLIYLFGTSPDQNNAQMNEARVHPSPARAGHSAPSSARTVPQSLWGSGEGPLPGPCSFLQVPGAAATGHRLAEGKCAVQSCLDFCCCVFSRCFYCEGPKSIGASPCKGLGRL